MDNTQLGIYNAAKDDKFGAYYDKDSEFINNYIASKYERIFASLLDYKKNHIGKTKWKVEYGDYKIAIKNIHLSSETNIYVIKYKKKKYFVCVDTQLNLFFKFSLVDDISIENNKTFIYCSFIPCVSNVNLHTFYNSLEQKLDTYIDEIVNFGNSESHYDTMICISDKILFYLSRAINRF